MLGSFSSCRPRRQAPAVYEFLTSRGRVVTSVAVRETRVTLIRRRLPVRSRTVALIFAAALGGAAAVALHAAHVLRRGEQAALDARYQLRTGRPDPRIVLVNIDD